MVLSGSSMITDANSSKELRCLVESYPYVSEWFAP